MYENGEHDVDGEHDGHNEGESARDVDDMEPEVGQDDDAGRDP